jgi:DNA-binding NarL/FixJ family response regulator
MIRILIADDHDLLREGLKRILADCDDISVVAEAADGVEALAKLSAYDVDMVLLDISMPGPPFLELIRRLRGVRPETRILVLSMHAEAGFATGAFREGAAGYLTKDRTADELAYAIREVDAGRRYLTGSLGEQVVAPDRSKE